MERLRALPGVAVAGAAQIFPLSGADYILTFVQVGKPPLPVGNQPNAAYYAATPGFLAALRKGRVAVYEPAAQVLFGGMFYDVRTNGDPAPLISAVRGAIRGLDPELPLDGVGTVDALVASSLSQRRFAMVLMAIFASLALVLAMLGIYGVISYSVTQATQENRYSDGSGSQKGDVLRMVFGYAGMLIMIGLTIGATATFGTGRLMASQLFEVKPTDPFAIVKHNRC